MSKRILVVEDQPDNRQIILDPLVCIVSIGLFGIRLHLGCSQLNSAFSDASSSARSLP
jgi:hypothetical protein